MKSFFKDAFLRCLWVSQELNLFLVETTDQKLIMVIKREPLYGIFSIQYCFLKREKALSRHTQTGFCIK